MSIINNDIILAIVICTFKRDILLDKCLKSIVPQINTTIEILVIDNKSSENTKKVVESYSNSFSNIKYFSEPNIGLSHARNRGIKEAKSDWILYLDDDTIAFSDLIERALYLVSRGDFDCVGGMYYGYFDVEKPKWIPENFGTKSKYSDDLQLCPFNVPHGCVVLYKKLTLNKIGCFDLQLGMNGGKIRYGEEVMLQKKIYENNGKIAFDPNLKIYHLVNKDNRLILRNMLIRKYQLGRSDKKELYVPITMRIYQVIKSFFGMAKRVFVLLFKLMNDKNYFWQNYIIDTIGPFTYYIGKL